MRSIEEAALDSSLPIETLRSILREQPVRIAICFGSHGRGETHARSDIDIAVDFDAISPSDPDYNDVIFGVHGALDDALSGEVDLVDLQAAPPELVTTVFDQGVLLVGEPDQAAARRDQLLADSDSDRSPRQRFDAAVARIDAHLATDGITATDGETRDR